MSLYDDLDTSKQLPDQNWGSSIKMLQSQLVIKSKQTQQKPIPNFMKYKKAVRPVVPVINHPILKKEELKPKSLITAQVTSQIITGKLC